MAPRVPSPVAGINVYALPLSTREGFVLSRVDGSASVEDIAIMVGIKHDELVGILERLADLGAVRLSWAAPKRNGAAAPAAAKAPSPVPEEKPLYAAKELDEPAQIPVETKKRILQAYYALEKKNYYECLGVARDAEKKAIRSAYFELSKFFHPDSLFGKELGSFKPKMEAVFKRLTEAYEALGRPQRRKEYDDYLASTQVASAMRETLEHGSRVPAAPSERPAPSEPRRAMVPPASPEATVERVNLRPPANPDARKQLAQDRLRRQFGDAKADSNPPSQPAAAQTPPSQPAPGARSRRNSAIKELRHSLRAAKATTEGSDAVLLHIKRARDAELAGDLLGAAGALQAALALEPDHKEIEAEYARVGKAVTQALADNYEKQARYEEKMGKWQAAATSWVRVSEGRPNDVHAPLAAAEALLKAGGDLHLAQRMAQRAVDLVPQDALAVTLLARVLLAAGLRLNARRELEKAVKLDPQNEMIKNLLLEAS
jgi:curved DNA-binding protein CbpA